VYAAACRLPGDTVVATNYGLLHRRLKCMQRHTLMLLCGLFLIASSDPTMPSYCVSTGIKRIINLKGIGRVPIWREIDRPGSRSGSQPYQNQDSFKTLITTRSRVQAEATWFILRCPSSGVLGVRGVTRDIQPRNSRAWSLWCISQPVQQRDEIAH
jgi:hypothetical protein